MSTRLTVDAAAAARAKNTTERRAEARAIVAANVRQPWLADADAARRARFVARRTALLSVAAPRGAEAVHGSIDFQPYFFLSEGTRVGRSVALVRTPSEGGSGFLVSDRLFITNNHVIGSIDDARATQLTFNYQLDSGSRWANQVRFRLAPDVFFFTSAEDDLDFTIVALGDPIDAVSAGMTFGYCPLSASDDKHAVGIPVNIIQHPQLMPKQIAIRNNTLVCRLDRVLQYETDTDVGSSGSPVFNDTWDVVALHHWGEPHLEQPADAKTAALVNEGVRISAIVDVLRTEAPKMIGDRRALAERAMALGDAVAAAGAAADDAAPVVHLGSGQAEGMARGGGSMASDTTITIPLSITIRVGAPVAGGVVVDAQPATAGPVVNVAPSGAEGVAIDTNPKNRSGYDPKFLDDAQPIPLPSASDDRFAALRDGSRELTYEHFSVKLHKDRKIAVFTATNIDGDTYKKIVRKTGEVSGAEASDVWAGDDRADASLYLGGPYYAATSAYFDKGHLTRREDPVWGDATIATRANADTFHYTNCSPQHWFFNESATMWQGIEKFVLENGALKTKNRLCVFQGPVLSDQYADFKGEKVPLEFWKVVVWISEQTKQLRVSAFKVSQESLLKLKRGDDRPPVVKGKDYVALYRVPLKSLAKAIDLDFGGLPEVDSVAKAGEGIIEVKALDAASIL